MTRMLTMMLMIMTMLMNKDDNAHDEKLTFIQALFLFNFHPASRLWWPCKQMSVSMHPIHIAIITNVMLYLYHVRIIFISYDFTVFIESILRGCQTFQANTFSLTWIWWLNVVRLLQRSVVCTIFTKFFFQHMSYILSAAATGCGTGSCHCLKETLHIRCQQDVRERMKWKEVGWWYNPDMEK